MIGRVLGGREHPGSLSVGLAELLPDESLQDLIARADEFLFHRKGGHMFFDAPADRTRLHFRIDELERRLALLEQPRESDDLERRLALLERPRESGPDQAATARDDDRRAASERRFGRRTTDRLHRTTNLEETDTGSEGARLVALEMLDAGHQPEQVTTYLRETFGLDEAHAALAVADPVPN